MTNYLRFIERKLVKIIIVSFLGSILFTTGSMFFHKERRAFTTYGDYNEQQAKKQNLETGWYYGWPVAISLPSLGLISDKSVSNVIVGSVLANLFTLFLFLITSVPNIVFWGSILFLVVLLILTMKPARNMF